MCYTLDSVFRKIYQAHVKEYRFLIPKKCKRCILMEAVKSVVAKFFFRNGFHKIMWLKVSPRYSGISFTCDSAF